MPPPRRNTPPAIARVMQTPIKADYPYLGQYSSWLLPTTDKILSEKGSGQLKFYDEVRRDDQVHACLSQLFGDITSRDWIVAPGGDKRIDRQAAESLQMQLESINWDEATAQMAEAIFWGYSIAEAEWDTSGDQVKLAGLYPRRRDRFHWNYDGQPMWKSFRHAQGEPILPNKYWHFSMGGDNSDDPNGRGLAYWLYWPTFFKRNGYRWWILFLEKYAKPHRHGQYRPNATDEEIDALETALQAFGEDDWTIAPEGNPIELIEASRSGGADYQGMVDICNAAISKIILGQTMTTDDGASLSQAQVHQSVKLQIAKALSDKITGSFSQTIGRWLTEWNYPGAKLPHIYRRFEEEVDLAAEADKDTKLLALGIALKPEAIAEKYGDDYDVETVRPVTLTGDQVGAMTTIITTAQQAGWKPKLVEAMLMSSFPLLPEDQVRAIVKNLGVEQPAGTQPGQPGQPPAQPLDPAEAGKILDSTQFSAPDPMMPLATALLDRLTVLDVAEFSRPDPMLPIATALLDRLNSFAA